MIEFLQALPEGVLVLIGVFITGVFSVSSMALGHLFSISNSKGERQKERLKYKLAIIETLLESLDIDLTRHVFQEKVFLAYTLKNKRVPPELANDRRMSLEREMNLNTVEIHFSELDKLRAQVVRARVGFTESELNALRNRELVSEYELASKEYSDAMSKLKVGLLLIAKEIDEKLDV